VGGTLGTGGSTGGAPAGVVGGWLAGGGGLRVSAKRMATLFEDRVTSAAHRFLALSSPL